jgi:hypothetical protein
MICLSCGVPAVISRWKRRNARQLPSVLWIFATSVPGAVWKRSAPLQTKRAELLRPSFVALEPTTSTCWPLCAPYGAAFYARRNETTTSRL